MSTTKTVEELEQELEILKGLIAKSVIVDTTAEEVPTEPKGPSFFSKLASKTKHIAIVPVTAVVKTVDRSMSYHTAKAALKDQLVAEGAQIRAAMEAAKAAQEESNKKEEKE